MEYQRKYLQLLYLLTTNDNISFSANTKYDLQTFDGTELSLSYPSK